jgi:hypothetical protein
MEALANAALSPGHILEYLSTGKVQKMGTAAIRKPFLIAAENEVFGTDHTVAYAANDNVLMWLGGAGDEFYARVPAAAPAIVIGDMLECDATGCLRKVALAATAVAIAIEAVDNSAGGAEARIAVMVY